MRLNNLLATILAGFHGWELHWQLPLIMALEKPNTQHDRANRMFCTIV